MERRRTADILVVRPDNDSIPVDAARRVIEFCSLAPVSLACRVAVILDAERMNAAAANALLKTLEEPSGNKRLILAAHCASMLPPTIVSRCSIVAAPPPDSEKAIQWLRQNGGDEKALAFCGGLPLHAAGNRHAKSCGDGDDAGGRKKFKHSQSGKGRRRF